MSEIIIMNSKIKTNIKELQSISPNPKYRIEMDEVIELYKSRKIENIRTARKIAEKFATIGKGSAGAAKSGMKLLKPYRTRQPATGKLSRGKKRSYLVKGTVTVKSQYITTNAKTKERKVNEKIFEDKEKYGITIDATSKEDAERQYRQQAEASFNVDGEGAETSMVFKNSEVSNVDINFIDEVSNGNSEANTPMRHATPVKYSFIPENAKYQENKGFCVIDNIVGIYSPLIKYMTKDYFISKINEYMTESSFNISDGITPLTLLEFCKDHNISMYAYDVTCNCFLKHITPVRNYPALIYYAVGGHMYLISDTDKCQSLVKRAYDKEVKIKSVVLKEDWQIETVNKFENKTYYKNVDITDLDKYTNGVIVVDKKDLSDELSEYIRTFNTIPEGLKNNKVSITQFHDSINDVIITTDPNDTRLVNYEVVKQICDEQQIPFTNQPLTAVVKQMRNKFMTTPRIKFDKEFRKQIFEDQNKCCQMCNEALKMSTFEIDHITALANGGTNGIDNLQILCKECHYTKTKDEAEEGWVKNSDTESSFNSETAKVYESDLARVWAFVEQYQPTHSEDLKLFGFDINKCRKNQMYYNKYNYPQFTVMDKVEEYKGDHSRAGKYYVECKRYFPLRGNGFYSQPMIEYCLNIGVIQESDIKYVMYSGCEIKHNYFNNLIDHYYKTLGKYNTDDFKIDKFAVNTMIGQFKQKGKEHWRSICITPDVNNAFYHYMSKHGCFIDNIKVDESNYHIVYEKFTATHEETESPIYDMILELEAIELHKLSEIIKSKNGTVLDLITDCVVCQFPDNINPFSASDGLNLDGYEFAPGVPKYKLEHKEERLAVERKKSYLRVDTFNYEKKEFQNIQDCVDDNFEPFVEMIIGGNKSINIDGRGGTGKSTLIGKLQNAMHVKGLSYVSLAPSNKAARVIGGETIHKFIKKHPAKIMKELNLDYIIIDEISMVHEMFYKYFMIIKKLKPNLKFIIAGNFDQLLPVKDRGCFEYENSVALFDLCEGLRLNLTKCRRSDDVCFNKCSPENIPNLTKSDFGCDFASRHLSYTNKKRISVNKTMMDKLVLHKKGKKSLNLDKLSYDKNSQDVRLLAGTPIIARTNRLDMNIYNNECFTIKEIQHSKGNILITDDCGETKGIPMYLFQKLFYVAYCITIHRCQGATYDHAYTIHEWDHPKFDNRLKYVALSRTTKLEHINII